MKKHVLKMYFILLLLGSSVGLLKAQIPGYCLPPYPPGGCALPNNCYVIESIRNFTNCDIELFALYPNCLQYVGIGTSYGLPALYPYQDCKKDSLTGVCLINPYTMMPEYVYYNPDADHPFPWIMNCMGGSTDGCLCQCPSGLGLRVKGHTPIANVFDYGSLTSYFWGIKGQPNTYRINYS